jgi:hypothetical protein
VIILLQLDVKAVLWQFYILLCEMLQPLYDPVVRKHHPMPKLRPTMVRIRTKRAFIFLALFILLKNQTVFTIQQVNTKIKQLTSVLAKSSLISC